MTWSHTVTRTPDAIFLLCEALNSGAVAETKLVSTVLLLGLQQSAISFSLHINLKDGRLMTGGYAPRSRSGNQGKSTSMDVPICMKITATLLWMIYDLAELRR